MKGSISATLIWSAVTVSILWLASFPKSGNTWLRAFLANYLFDAREPYSLEKLQRFGLSDADAAPYAKLAGKPHTDLTEAEYAVLRPQVHRSFAASSRENVLVKTHNAIGDVAGVPTITEAVSLGAIYVIRNPWDVAVSYADHFGVSLDDAVIALARPSLMIEPSSSNVRQYLGGWSGHVGSWNSARQIPLLVIRYEDMAATPEATFAKVVNFMGLPPDAARLSRAIRFSSFGELSAQEAKSGFAERSVSAKRFFRQGQVGGWRDVLSDDQARRIADDHRPALQAYSYLDQAGGIQDGSDLS